MVCFKSVMRREHSNAYIFVSFTEYLMDSLFEMTIWSYKQFFVERKELRINLRQLITYEIFISKFPIKNISFQVKSFKAR